MPGIAEQEGTDWQGSQPIIEERGVGTGNPSPVQSLLPEGVAGTQNHLIPQALAAMTRSIARLWMEHQGLCMKR